MRYIKRRAFFYCFCAVSILLLFFLPGCPLFRYKSTSIDPFLVNLEGINTQHNDYNAYAPTSIMDEFGIIYSTDFPSSGSNLDMWSADITLRQSETMVNVEGTKTGAFYFAFNSEADERGPILTGPYYFDHYQEEGSTAFYPDYFDPDAAGADDLYFLFSRDKSSENRGFDILTSRFIPEENGWSEPKSAGFNSFYNDYYPCCDGEYIYFASDRNGNDDIYRTPYIDDTSLLETGEIEAVDELNSSFNDSCPYVYTEWATDIKIMVFSSDREGGAGFYDIYYSFWDDENKTWQTPALMGNMVNSPHNEYRPTLYTSFTMEPFKYILLFSSDRPGGTGGYDLYIAGSETLPFE